jgi:RNA polymerase sigma-70 factor (ECF subfamily)
VPLVDPSTGADGPGTLDAALAGAQAGDEWAFRVVYRTVQPGLLRYLRGLVGEDADDVASESWGHIVKGLASFHGNGNDFRAWAATIARHRALDHLRHLRRRPMAADGGYDLVPQRPATDDTEALALESVSTEQAIALIATLPSEQAEAVLLRTVMGLDAETAGRVLGKRAGAVRTAAHRGLRRLAATLAEPTAPDSAVPSEGPEVSDA